MLKSVVMQKVQGFILQTIFQFVLLLAYVQRRMTVINPRFKGNGDL